MLFATGLDPERSTVFCQSHVSAHAEAAWLLGSVTSFGELRRMTQFKDKGERQEFVSAALFTYPVLMAGDILLYQADRVPIGDDQRQHLELARDVAERFNARFGETFVLPEGIYPEVGARIMDLQEPDRKMSTTGGTPQGTIGMLDPPEAIVKKFRSAVTDSGRDVVHDPDGKPGISNLIEIMHVATGEPIEGDRDALRRPGLRRVQAGRGARRSWRCSSRSGRGTRSCAPTRASCGACWSKAPRRRGRRPRPTLGAMLERMGFVAR